MKAPDIQKHRAQTPQREGVEKIYVPLDSDTEAVVEITIKTRGLGHIDNHKCAVPTARQLHQVADLLFRRVYHFTETTD